MDQFHQNLRFDRQERMFPRRLIPIIGIAIVFTALWLVVPPTTLYWLLLFLFSIAVWVASYGWRLALTALDHLIQRLQEL